MFKFYIGLWWFSFIQFPLFYLLGWAADRHFFNCATSFGVCLYFDLYMILLASFMPLPIILTIILGIRAWMRKIIGKQEIALAVGAWIFSLYDVYEVFIVTGGHLSKSKAQYTLEFKQ